jgi:hypothetical protein
VWTLTSRCDRLVGVRRPRSPQRTLTAVAFMIVGILSPTTPGFKPLCYPPIPDNQRRTFSPSSSVA